MFAPTYFAPDYFAPGYFPQRGGTPAPGSGGYFAASYFAPTCFAPTYFPSADETPPPSASTLEQAILARALGSSALAALIGARFEPHDVPQGGNDEPSYPCVVYRMREDLHVYHLDGEGTLARAVVRFEARSRDFDDCRAIAEAFRNLFSGYRGTVGSVVFLFSKLVPPGQDSDYDPNDDDSDLGVHRKSFDYKFTYRVSAPTLN